MWMTTAIIPLLAEEGPWAPGMCRLRAAGVSITPDNLKISERAVICMPYHVLQDCLEEDRLGDAKYGSTKRGIAPVYGDKYLKKVIRMGDLRYPEFLERRVKEIVDWKNLFIRDAYKADAVSADEMIAWLKKFGGEFLDYVSDVGSYLNDAAKAGKNIMFEAQLGALRDIDFGINPYTSSSNTVAAYAPVGAGDRKSVV